MSPQSSRARRIAEALRTTPQDPAERPWSDLVSMPPQTRDEALEHLRDARETVAMLHRDLATGQWAHVHNATAGLPTARAQLSRARAVLAMLDADDAATRRMAATADNRAAISTLLDHTPLPHPSVTPLPDGVLVTVADVDDLDRWHHELGGRVAVGQELHGFRLWVLRTEVERRGGVLVVWVSASVPVRAAVMPELAAAAADTGLAVA